MSNDYYWPAFKEWLTDEDLEQVVTVPTNLKERSWLSASFDPRVPIPWAVSTRDMTLGEYLKQKGVLMEPSFPEKLRNTFLDFSDHHQGRKNVFGLDFETWSDVDLPKKGAANYFAGNTIPLLAAFAVYDNTHGWQTYVFDFVFFTPGYDKETFELTMRELHHNEKLAAHNASFEYSMLMKKYLSIPYSQFIDTAVVSSYYGGGRRLAQASAQFTSSPKMEEGVELIKLFSIPNEKFDFEPPTAAKIRDLNLISEWKLFKHYCAVDAQASCELARNYPIDYDEQKYSELTHRMNQLGWKVDVESAKQMHRIYRSNLANAEAFFRTQTNEFELNLFSPIQLKAWCRERGVNATSFDEKHVKQILQRVNDKLATMPITDPRVAGYRDVQLLLQTKQTLGGSALKKLDVILNQVTNEGFLKDQYLHLGASQTFRTTGRGVQMQNLKRLSNMIDMEELHDIDAQIDNEQLATNLRQLFTSRWPEGDGQLVVGDFSSVEGRGLAWLAGETWKLNAYYNGQDQYKVLAAEHYGISYNDVDKQQRMFGKVGELSCGYGAGPNAVTSFAEGMGIKLSEVEALDIVRTFRNKNAEIVSFWAALDACLKQVMTDQTVKLEVGPKSKEFYLRFELEDAPVSLCDYLVNPKTLVIEFRDIDGVLFSRRFHGVHQRGRNICYYKPTDRKTGALWTNTYTDVKTKQRGYYDIYGGKLAGILTQSLCREIFFAVAMRVEQQLCKRSGAELIGQFHDELIVDVSERSLQTLHNTSLGSFKIQMDTLMSTPQIKGVYLPVFPLGAEVKSSWRYTK